MMKPSETAMSPATKRSATLIFSFVTLFLVVLLIIGQYFDRRFEQSRWKVEQAQAVASISTMVSSYYFQSLTDLLLLTADKALYSGTGKSNAELIHRLRDLAEVTRSYHQLRFIDTKGQEQVRINFTNGKSQLVPPDQLQNKAHRPYFKNSIDLNEGEVFISRFDLNVERHKIEKPIRPMIRFAAPVFDVGGERKGIVVLNFLGEKLLHLFAINERKSLSRLLLINGDGYYLYSNNPGDNWGFLFQNRPKFSDHFSEWETISTTPSGQLTSANGLFSYATLHRLNDIDQNWLKTYTLAGNIQLKTEEAPWRIVAFIDTETLNAASLERLKYFAVVALFVLLLIFFLIVVWSRSRDKAASYERRQKLYAQVVEQSKELIYITEPDGVIHQANHAVEECTGYTLDEIIGKKPSIFKSGKQTDAFYRQLWQRLKSGKSFEGVFVNRRKDGTHFHEMKLITPIFDASGEITHYVSTGRDISELRNMHLKEILLSANMASALSHHFGNILNGVLGHIYLAEQVGEEPDNKVKKSDYLKEALKSLDAATLLLEDIRSLDALGLVKYDKIDLVSLLESVVGEESLELSQDIQLHSNISENLPKIHGEPGQLKNVLRALLKNAREAVSGSGDIYIGAKTRSIEIAICSACNDQFNGEYVDVSVSDSGEGIESNNLHSIWDPFFTTKKTANLVGVTPGLGLTIVRNIIHSHDGHLLVETEKAKGTTIHMFFPVALADREEIPESEESNTKILS